jgi:hypothetical protein
VGREAAEFLRSRVGSTAEYRKLHLRAVEQGGPMKQTGLFGTGAVLLIGLALLVTVGMFVARSRRQSAV